jgi:hypothetical protein
MEKEMSKLVTIAMTTLSVLALSTAFAQAAGNDGIIITKPPILQVRPVVACAVQGTPSEFPDDVMIFNKGAGVIAAGTKVHWSVPFANKQGNYTLASALQPGKGVFLGGVLPGGVEAGKPCAAKIV